MSPVLIKLGKSRTRNLYLQKTNQFQKKKGNTGKSCRHCGGNYLHCPAKEKQCRKCLKHNHFAAVCRGPPAKAVKPSHLQSGNTKRNKKKHIRPIKHETDNDPSSDSDDYFYAMQADKSSPKANVKMFGHMFKMTKDT